MKTTIRNVAVWMAAATLLATGAARAQDLTPVKVISSLPTLTSAATYLMDANKYDEAHGLDVEITQAGGSSSLQIDAVLAGSATFGHPGTATALQAIRAGAEITILGAAANNQITGVISNAALEAAGVALDAPIEERMQALKGLTIGTNPVGATYYQMLRVYLKQYGLDPDNDVRLVGVTDSSALISGIEQGAFDAIVTASGITEQAISIGAGQLLFSGARGDFPGSDTSMVLVVVARNDTVETQPELVDAYRAALGDALVELNNEHDAAGKVLRDLHFAAMSQDVWDPVWTNATAAYPEVLSFTRGAYDFWLENDAEGPESYSAVDYEKVVYAAAQGD